MDEPDLIIKPFFRKKVNVANFWHQPLIFKKIDIIDTYQLLVKCINNLGITGVDWDASVNVEETGMVRMLVLEIYFKEEKMKTHFLLI